MKLEPLPKRIPAHEFIIGLLQKAVQDPNSTQAYARQELIVQFFIEVVIPDIHRVEVCDAIVELAASGEMYTVLSLFFAAALLSLHGEDSFTNACAVDADGLADFGDWLKEANLQLQPQAVAEPV